MKQLFYCVFVISLVFSAASSKAEPPDAKCIMEKMKNVLESYSTSQKVNIIIKNRDEQTGQLVAGSARKILPDGNRSLIVLLEPKNLKGLAYLFRELKDQSIDQWTYPPYLGRVRKISNVNAYESFLNTDFTYADLRFIDSKSNVKLLEEVDLDGSPTYKMEIIPQEKSHYYSRSIMWISKDTFLPLRRDYYDMNKTLWKRQLFEQITYINGVPIPFRVRMLDLKAKTSTEFNIIEINSGVELPDAMFVPEQLKFSLKCPVWEKVCYPPQN